MPSIQEYVRHFRLIDSQVRAVFMINGQVVGLVTFGKPQSFSKVFKKLVESYALDAIDWLEPKKEHKALKSDVTKFMKASQAAQPETHPSVGLGTDYRLKSKKITGFALALDGQVLHLSIFAKANGHNQNKYTSKMQRLTQRRRNRV